MKAPGCWVGPRHSGDGGYRCAVDELARAVIRTTAPALIYLLGLGPTEHPGAQAGLLVKVCPACGRDPNGIHRSDCRTCAMYLLDQEGLLDDQLAEVIPFPEEPEPEPA